MFFCGFFFDFFSIAVDLILSREAREREEDLERESGGLREKWGIHLGARRPANGSSRRPETGIWWKPRCFLTAIHV